MRKEIKILIGIMAVLILALPLMSTAMAAEVNGEEPDESGDAPQGSLRRLLAALNMQQGRWKRFIWFFKGAEKDTLSGTVTARHRNILILTDGNGERYNVVLPANWNVGSEVISLNEMFEEGYVNIGDEVTLEVLKRTVENENEVTLTIFFGYEIENEDTGHIFYAVLPVNIEG